MSNVPSSLGRTTSDSSAAVETLGADTEGLACRLVLLRQRPDAPCWCLPPDTRSITAYRCPNRSRVEHGFLDPFSACRILVGKPRKRAFGVLHTLLALRLFCGGRAELFAPCRNIAVNGVLHVFEHRDYVSPVDFDGVAVLSRDFYDVLRQKPAQILSVASELFDHAVELGFVLRGSDHFGKLRVGGLGVLGFALFSAASSCLTFSRRE